MISRMTANPWLRSYCTLRDPEVLKRLLTRPAIEVAGLDAMPVEMAKQALEKALRAVYVPSVAGLEIIGYLVEKAYLHAVEKYPSPGAFVRGIYSESPPLEPDFVTCITGLAGVGKTQMLRELRRVIGSGHTVDIDQNHKSLPLVPLLYVEQRVKAKTGEVLRGLLAQFGLPENPKKPTNDRLVRELKHRAFNAASCLVICDEVQLASLSASANTFVTHQLLTLRDVGLPFAAALNYSVLHKLKQRPAEDRQRLLSDVLVLHPPQPDSRCFSELLEQYRAVAPIAFRLDLVVHAERIHRMTAGLPRLIILLFKCAYGIARKAKDTGISITHLEQAYRSIQFSQNREEVEAIERLKANPRAMVKIGGKVRTDLICPFHELAADTPEITAAKERAQQETAEKVLASTLSIGERKALQAFERREGVVILPPAQKVRRPSVRRPSSGAELISNLMALDQKRSMPKGG